MEENVEEKMSLVDTLMYTYIHDLLHVFQMIPMTPLKNFVKWLETGQKSKQTMPGWDQNVKEIQGLAQPCINPKIPFEAVFSV